MKNETLRMCVACRQMKDKRTLTRVVKNKEGFVSESDGNVTVVLDVSLTEELKQKGLVREFISTIQQTRKDIGLEVTDHIKISVCGDEEITKVLQKFQNEIKAGTLCDEIDFATSGRFEFKNNDKKAVFDVKKA